MRKKVQNSDADFKEKTYLLAINYFKWLEVQGAPQKMCFFRENLVFCNLSIGDFNLITSLSPFKAASMYFWSPQIL